MYKNAQGAIIYFDQGWKLSKNGLKALKSFDYKAMDSKDPFPSLGEWRSKDGQSTCTVDAAHGSMEEKGMTLIYWLKKAQDPTQTRASAKFVKFVSSLDLLVDEKTFVRFSHVG